MVESHSININLEWKSNKSITQSLFKDARIIKNKQKNNQNYPHYALSIEERRKRIKIMIKRIEELKKKYPY